MYTIIKAILFPLIFILWDTLTMNSRSLSVDNQNDPRHANDLKNEGNPN